MQIFQLLAAKPLIPPEFQHWFYEFTANKKPKELRPTH